MAQPHIYGGPLSSYLEDEGDPSDLNYSDAQSWQARPKALERTTPATKPGIMRQESNHRTLITSNLASSKQSRFEALFSTAMSPRLSPRESSRFVDRFRYIICTSQLLAETVTASELMPTKGGMSFSFDDGEQARWDARKAAKYWMGSGGCVILVSLLITWAMRTQDRGVATTKAHRTAALTLSLLMALFLYAQSRRSYSRYLHSRASTHIQSTVSHCQRFDSLVCRIINTIQEVELVSRGYRIGTVLPPIARIEACSKERRCHRLRSALVSALNLVFTAAGRACSALDHLTNRRDFNKLSDVYNIILNDEDDLSLLCDAADGVGHLKILFAQTHARRRKLLCYLLAVHADGRPGNSRVWRVVVDQLASISSLLQNLVKQLEETMDEDTHALDPNQIAFLDSPATHNSNTMHERQRTQARGINTLSQALKRTQAKMYILREESGKLLQAADAESGVRAELIDHYDSLGTDLKALLADWEDGRRLLLDPKSPTVRAVQDLDVSEVPSSEQGESQDQVGELETQSLVIRPDSLGYWGPRMSMHNVTSGVNNAQYLSFEDALKEEVFEGDNAAPAINESGSKSVSRAERIAIMRREREIKQARSEERRLQQQARSSLQGELKDVLGHRSRRPLGLRLSIHNPRYASSALPYNTSSVMSPPLNDGDRKVSTASQQSTNTMNSALGSSIASTYDY